MDINSLAHTKWNCKYHIVFALKYRRKVAYGKMKQDIAYTYDLRTPCKFKIQIWESPFLVQRILRRYCRENAKKIQEYIQNQLQNYRQLIGIIIVGNACISVDMLQEIAEVVLIQPAELKAA